MIDLHTSFQNLIKLAEVTRIKDDSFDFPQTQISSMGKISDAHELYPYGICAVAPKGSLAVSLNIQGQEENKAFIATLVNQRFKNLKEGEVAVGNFLTGAFVKFLEDGTLEISTDGDIKINAGTGKVAFGNDTEELLDLVDQLLTELISATVLDPISGPLPFSASVITNITAIKTALATIKGTL